MFELLVPLGFLTLSTTFSPVEVPSSSLRSSLCFRQLALVWDSTGDNLPQHVFSWVLAWD